MGVVYKARHLELNRVVALKMILAGANADEEEMKRFRTEAEAIARLQHPNIVQIHEIGTHNGLPFFSLEFCSGGSLGKHLAGTPLPPRDAAALVETLARATYAVHQKGVIHRDLKPANVLLQQKDEVGRMRDEIKKPSDSSFILHPSSFLPKITDFGLAKLEQAGHTATGAIMGTPSYMAPEQASGMSNEVGPAADTYALGAIFYELLTGRPPFKGTSSQETLEQVRSQEPVPPSRLQPKTPRDAETICLKCLHKEPSRRYASAWDLAEDLRRFGAGEPIQARPVGRMEKAVKWVKRRPTLAALWAVGLVALVSLVGAGFWVAQVRADQRTTRARQEGERYVGVTSALDRGTALLEEGKLKEAGVVLREARDRLGDADVPELRDRIEQAYRNLDLLGRLEIIRLRKAILAAGKFDYQAADRSYQATFAEAGLAAKGDSPEAVAERLRYSKIRRRLVAYLDDWAGTTSKELRPWLLAAARQVDPGVWRDRFRDAAVWEDRQVLQNLAAEVKPLEESPELLAVLGDRLKKTGADPVPFLKRALDAYPEDFWLNLHLGNDLSLAGKRREAAEYFRAAIVLRPEAAAAHNNLGGALFEQGRLEEATASFQKSTILDPEYSGPYGNLAAVLAEQGKNDQALKQIDEALVRSPNEPTFYNTRGLVLAGLDRPQEAIAAYRKALTLNPKLAQVWANLAEVLIKQKDWAAVRDVCQEALAAGSTNAEILSYLGSALLEKGQLDEAIRQLTKAAKLAPQQAVIHYNLGNALAKRGRMDEALASYRRAAQINPQLVDAQYNLGWGLLQQSRLTEAIDAFRQALAQAPRDGEMHEVLIKTLLRAGRFEEARAATNRALKVLPEKDPARPAVVRLGERCDKLLTLERDFPALVRGEKRPADAPLLLLAQMCRYKQAFAAAVRYYGEAFAADPGLANKENHRDNAACCAVQAASGHGRDSLLLNAAEQTSLRRQALRWLRDDLAGWTRRAERNTPEDRTDVEKILTTWETDAELADVRDDAALARLSEEERAEWRKFWQEVKALLARVR
jgi:serine/threonine-protein kinase